MHSNNVRSLSFLCGRRLVTTDEHFNARTSKMFDGLALEKFLVQRWHDRFGLNAAILKVSFDFP